MHVLKFILQMTKPYRKFIYGAVFAICYVAADHNIRPYLIKIIIDDVSQNYYARIWTIIGIYAFTQFMMVWAWTFYDWCHNKFSPQLTSHIVKTMVDDISAYPYRFFQENHSGRVMSKVKDAAKCTPRIIETVLVELLQLAIVIIISIILLATVNYVFALAMFVWVSIFITITFFAALKSSVLSSREAESDSQTGGMVVDYFANMFSIKIFISRDYERKRLKNHLNDYIAKSRAKGLHLKAFFTTQGMIFSFYILGCLCGMVYLAQRGLISPGAFALVFMLHFEVVNRLFHLATLMNDLMSNWGAVEQALVILDNKPGVQDKPGAGHLLLNESKIVFEDVGFYYHGAEKLFHNKSVTIKHGEKVGLVGYSGGGKTTFVNLIMRLYDVTAGRVLIDGQDIRNVTQDSLRSSIGMIPQDPTLFNRSLLDNIHYGRLDATNAEVIIAAKRAHAHEFILKLPQGYDSLVGERGVKLSGGQRQRIAIARAFLKNAPILILDEATSQLDSVTELIIQESLWDLMRGKTTIVIAHRLSTLLHMDRILVFANGKIVEDGTHNELLAANGLYKTLWNAQVGGFLPET